ncbi:hypothetical protein UFOVP1362_3 [uncultured Caudovirales phage]|uniref:Uncharacterized protein n=1 Tax=uncultured Caudovirales phage TaxID=2100421 RepID=A0A6J5QN14_9CAUD|nr:hypothetical protein UFOVP1101_23 [uncultured Caudovirales phage]CAB4201895.1 hypothetical protein UFOVP1362_3 [uncultured Caudovirales phage]
MITIVEVDAKINSHVDVCAVRYESIEKEMTGVNARLKRIEQILLGVAGTLILLLLQMVLKI